ncbi:hypothetical protein LPA44_15500 [Halobacterium sp. KA-4]|uniref:hypothetical protein n=1 Tax=Halobacterium sp. KA-4 TaxID=2896367 RepID=UPI001E461272|nr:hypothetical protein [Halobacterium sp. KA-4]MCD2201278.1 hypothetical protein [Halobacterium sp. KA-4]
MVPIDTREETLIKEALAELGREEYQHDHYAQGAFLFALDLRDHASNLNILETQFHVAVDKVLDSNLRAREQIQSSDLPTGFAEEASRGKINLPDLRAREINHEYLLYPGKSLIHDIVEEHYELFCGQDGIQARLKEVYDDVNREFLLTTTILTAVASQSVVAFIPFAVACSYYIAHQELDQICATVATIEP